MPVPIFNVLECRCAGTFGHMNHLIHKWRIVRVSVMMHLAAYTNGPNNALHVKRNTENMP
jgi:hypothetical protein